MVIDFHTHAFPDELAPRAMEHLVKNARGHLPFLDGTVSALLESMDRASIERSVLCSIATAPKQFDSILAFSDQVRSDRIEPFPSVHPAADDIVSQVRRVAREGFKGIKLHPAYQGFVTDAEEAMPLYETAVEEGLMILFHAGEDFAFPDASICDPEHIEPVARRFGDLVIIAAHMGGYRRWEEARDRLAGMKNVIFDTSFSLDEMGRGLLDEILRRHGADRIVFGTDSPWADQAQAIELLKSLGFSPDVERAWLSDNAARLLDGCTPAN